MENFQIKSLEAGIEDVNNEGIVTIVISTFDTEDMAHDIVRKGAFADTFCNDIGRIKHVVDHIHDVEHVVGTPLSMEEVGDQAIVQSKLILEKAIAHDLFVTYKHMAEQKRSMEHSYAYRVEKSNQNHTLKGRDIAKLSMFEYSTVFRGCNPLTPQLDVKGFMSADDCVSYMAELEQMLRKCDFTDEGGRRIEQAATSLRKALNDISASAKGEAFNRELVAAFKETLFN